MTSPLAAWRKLLIDDMTLIQGANIQPGALILRLTEVLSGRYTDGWWPKFSAPGHGQSSCVLDGGKMRVTLDFRHEAEGQETLAKLKQLEPEFRAITSLTTTTRAYGRHSNVHLIITLELDPRPTPGPND
jgi:hypothetical protein